MKIYNDMTIRGSLQALRVLLDAHFDDVVDHADHQLNNGLSKGVWGSCRACRGNITRIEKLPLSRSWWDDHNGDSQAIYGYSNFMNDTSYANCIVFCDTADLTLAAYYPETRTMWATDWLHNEITAQIILPVAKQILQICREQYGLVQHHEIPTAKKKHRTCTIGADPEFEVTGPRGGIIPAIDIIDDPHYDEPIGLDGAKDQCELRPQPGAPSKVISNMLELLDNYHATYPNYGLCATGDTYPIGGHIHVGMGESYHPTPELCRSLDYLLGIPTLGLSGRARGNYGGAGKFEAKLWGFEYRTPPSAIFATRTMAATCLRLTSSIVNRFLNTPNGTMFEINTVGNNPTMETLVDWGLSKCAAKHFLTALDWETIPNPLVGWGITTRRRGRPHRATAKIVFRDYWLPSVRLALQSRLEHILPTHASVTLYGLSRSRGDVATFGNVYETVLHPITAGASWYGLPFTIRQGEPSYNLVDTLARSIARQERGD